jgi:tRNA(Ile)-lysidine synthase
VARAVSAHRLWEAGARVAVAVSGGRDSVVLLDLLLASRGLHGGELSVVTVDHGTRSGSDEDAAFVEALAASCGLSCVRFDRSLGAQASEQACRDARYASFETLDVDVIALAHHARDQVETALLGWMRGSGTLGMAGMAHKRGRYVRPLLELQPSALAAWAETRGLAWREDPSNQSDRFARNRIRHEVLPLLEAIRPGAVRAMARGVAHAAEDARHLDALAVGAAPWPTSEVAWGPPAIVRRQLARGLPGARSTHLDAIVAAARRGRGIVELSPSVHVMVDDVWVRIKSGVDRVRRTDPAS